MLTLLKNNLVLLSLATWAMEPAIKSNGKRFSTNVSVLKNKTMDKEINSKF